MSSSTHPTILYDSDIEDAFSLTNITNYTLASPSYSSASMGNTFSYASEDPSEDQLVLIAVSPFHDDPYMKDFYSGNDHRGYPGSPPIRYKESFGCNLMAPNRTSTSATPAITQAVIRKLIADSVATALEAQTANMANADNTDRNYKPREAPITKRCSYKEFMSCQPFNFKGSKGAVRLIC
nr:hypothetical protein [Tanacetum cinerariifolium]